MLEQVKKMCAVEILHHFVRELRKHSTRDNIRNAEPFFIEIYLFTFSVSMPIIYNLCELRIINNFVCFSLKNFQQCSVFGFFGADSVAPVRRFVPESQEFGPLYP